MKDESIAAEAVASATAAVATAVTAAADTAVWLDPGCAWTWALAQKWEQDSAAAAGGPGSGNEPEGNRAR